MSVSLNEFKKRFGKKPIDTVKPEDRYKERLEEVKPKIEAGMKRGEKDAVDAWAAIKLCAGKKDWHGAADLLDEMAPKLSIDDTRAMDLREDLAAQAQRALYEGKLASALRGAHDAVEAAIVADDYDDAEDQLDDFKGLVDDYLAACVTWDKRVAELAGKVEQVMVRKRASALPQPTKDEAEFAQKTSALRSAVTLRDLGAADPIWTDINLILDRLLAAPLDQSPDALKQLYETRRAAAKKNLDYWVVLAGDPDPLLAGHQAALGALKKDVDDADAYFGNAEYKEALQSLDQATAAFPALTAAVKAQNSDFSTALAPIAKDVAAALRGNTLPPTVPTDLDTKALYKAYTGRTAASNNGDYVKAIHLFKAYEGGFQTIWQELQKQPLGTAPVSPKAAEYQLLIQNADRAALTAALNAPDADLAAFRAQPGAAKLLDDMVAVLGGKADSKEKQAFVQAAMKARFNLKEVSGGGDGKGMSTKALPRMYKLFAMLPPSHTTDNELITSVERVKAHDTSLLDADKKKIVLKAGKTGKEGGTFDDTTLHEIAHGVDAKFKFMETNGQSRKFGGWRNETKEAVQKVAADDLEFYSHFEKKSVPRALLEKYLDLVFSGSNPTTLQAQFKAAGDPTVVSADELKKHPAVKHAADKQEDAKKDSDDQRDLAIAARKMIKDREPKKSMLSTIVEAVAFGKKPDEAIKALLDQLAFPGEFPSDAMWKEMAVHPAIDFASNVGLKNGSSGLWDQGNGGAERCAVNGRVYQEAYANNWVSYLLSARGAKVSDYQFRHRMEWFAECYSRFFLNKLPPSHPLVPWLQEQKDAAK